FLRPKQQNEDFCLHFLLHRGQILRIRVRGVCLSFSVFCTISPSRRTSLSFGRGAGAEGLVTPDRDVCRMTG
uniref:Uncharacterized protein n=1 Tax=Poecilia reticulata TaxID=8081 RepID=A0A3P9PRF2_POERE